MHSSWTPDPATLAETNIYTLMRQVGARDYAALHAWSVQHRGDFWQTMIERLGVLFQKPYRQIVDLADGVENPRWLVDAQLNIAESCFLMPPSETAVVYGTAKDLRRMSCGELRQLAERVAHNLRRLGVREGEAIAIDMPMTVEAVGVYLGSILAGIPVVGIADSFAPHEIATRLRLGGAKLVFTQDVISRGDKRLPMYDKVKEAGAARIIVLAESPRPDGDPQHVQLRTEDMSWRDFLQPAGSSKFAPVACLPETACNILFSSGTTGDPKTIPWTHTTPIKCAVDAHLHHDIRPGELLAWPTSLGWMMGPWLIYASLMNRAGMALYYGQPTGRDFLEFVAAARVSMLGVVPSIVKAWRQSHADKGLDLTGIRCFSSTGECSNAEDMSYLMQSAGGKPVIEYCGGTEIGGGYITGSMVQTQHAAAFSTPALGLDFVILDEEDKPSADGELYIIPPSIGLSLKLLNNDHHQVYYERTPRGPKGELLRRHGDQVQALGNGYWRAHGRVDDTMNLGGIKVSCIEIEKTLNTLPEVHETAAIAVNPPGGGPSLLVVYAVLKPGMQAERQVLQRQMQESIKQRLNPLFKIHDLVFIPALPRTASNKVMRRVLRSQYKAA